MFEYQAFRWIKNDFLTTHQQYMRIQNTLFVIIIEPRNHKDLETVCIAHTIV